MNQTATRPAWEAGPPDGFDSPPHDDRPARPAQLPALPGAVPDGDLPDAISRALVPMQLGPPDALPAKPSANVAKRVAAVMAEIERIEKRGHNKHFSFDFATIDDIRAAMAALCGKHGLAWRQTELRIFPLGKMLGVTYQFTLLAEDEPDHEAFPSTVTVLTAIMTRGGLDEKAFSKARALAWKDWAKSQFSIPTGEDPEEADPDASGGAPADRNGPPHRANGNGSARRPSGPYGYIAGDGQRHQSDTAEEWMEAWRKRIRAFVMAKRLEDLRTAARANADEIKASGEHGETIRAEIEAALAGPQAGPGDDQTAGTEAAAPAKAEEVGVAPGDVPAVRKANGPEKWTENFIAAVAKCGSLAVLDALIVREKQSIETIRANHGDLNASLTRAVLERRGALEAAAKGQA